MATRFRVSFLSLESYPGLNGALFALWILSVVFCLLIHKRLKSGVAVGALALEFFLSYLSRANLNIRLPRLICFPNPRFLRVQLKASLEIIFYMRFFFSRSLSDHHCTWKILSTGAVNLSPTPFIHTPPQPRTVVSGRIRNVHQHLSLIHSFKFCPVGIRCLHHPNSN